MKLIFTYGLPATGKLTVARELASLTGYKVFHNHLVVDTLLSVFEFGNRPFVELREEIWLWVFREACAAGLPGLMFTFAPERTVRRGFVQAAVDGVQQCDGQVDFVELVCPLGELKERMENASRVQHRKLASVPLFEQLHSDGVFDSSHMPAPRLRVDTSLMSPLQAALEIARSVEGVPAKTVEPYARYPTLRRWKCREDGAPGFTNAIRRLLATVRR